MIPDLVDGGRDARAGLALEVDGSAIETVLGRDVESVENVAWSDRDDAVPHRVVDLQVGLRHWSSIRRQRGRTPSPRLATKIARRRA